jgi:adenylate cyclase 3
VLFIWRLTVEEQSEKAADMRRRNESLVYNILPPHVAEHFLKPGAPRRHDELYSQSYAEVGVLFASMPNFSDFYTEESVNNQGLECLRFLNEVISDYDAVSLKLIATLPKNNN